jgi:hypothetical protein
MTNAPDPERLGGIGWVRRTGGSLTKAERRRLLAASVRGQGEYLAGRIKLLAGRVPAGVAELDDPDLLAPPDSAWARAAEEACREQLPATIGHSYRSWAFGRAIAALDRVPVDAEILYTAALVHDHGLEHSVAGQDFTLRSADRVLACAREAGAGDERGELAADAIVAHATPGAHPAKDGAGAWLQAGAMCDLIGARLWDLPRPWVARVVAEHPRDGVVEAITGMIRAESKAMPDGRFALIRRCGFASVMRVAPKFGS